MPSHLLAAVWMGAVLSSVPAPASPGLSGDVDLELVRLPPSEAYPDGAVEGAIRMACSERLDALRDFFFTERQPFRAQLLRSQADGFCHIFYEPTVPGFRALPDDHGVAELIIDVDSLSFLETGTSDRGDAVGALEAILRESEQPLRVSISLPTELPDRLYRRAVAERSGRSDHSIRLHGRVATANLGWAQDYIKSGRGPRGATVLVPHRVYQGDAANGPRYASLIERLAEQDARVVRSKLAWEGGDLQFTLDPGDPGKLILYYGAAAKPYWGEALTPAEYEYVLTREFGADRAVDLSGMAPHVDFVVSFLPRSRTVLFAVPETGNRELASSAAEALIDRFGRYACPEPLIELGDSLKGAGPIAEDRVRRGIERVRREDLGSALGIDARLGERMQAFVEAFCPDRLSCFSPENQERMIDLDPGLFSEWVAVAREMRNERAVVDAHLELIAGQLEPLPSEMTRRIQEKIAELEALGFRVVRVPAVRANLDRESGWPGVSYVNLLAVGSQLFVPSFGLGAAEGRLLEGLARDLGPDYTIVPVFSRDVLIRNGGVHCLFGIVREGSRDELRLAAVGVPRDR